MPTFTIRKLDLAGRETYAYPGALLARTPTSITLEAFFSRYERLDLGYAVFERGDRFVETFFTDRWYNIFEIYAAETNHLKGWYCNLARPAVIEDGAEATPPTVSAVDLALDVWVSPAGAAHVLDEAEFAALPLRPQEIGAVRAACAELLDLARHRAGPFAKINAPPLGEEGHGR